MMSSIRYNPLIVVILILLLVNVCESFTSSSSSFTHVHQHHVFNPRTRTTQQSQSVYKKTNSISKINLNNQQQRIKIPLRVVSSSLELSSLSAALPSLSSLAPVGSLLILVLLILIHESGHYIAARSFSIKVDEFSVGVGPKVAGFTAFGNDFNIRALPLGGYVKFPEHYNTTAIRIADIEDEKEFRNYIKTLNLNIVTQVINAFTLGFLLENKWNDEKQKRIIEAQELLAKKQQNQFQFPFWKSSTTGSGPEAISTINNNNNNDREYYDDPYLLQNRPAIERIIVLSGGIIFNILTSLIIYISIISFGTGIPTPIFNEGIIVTTQPAINTAASGKLYKGDVIIGINNLPINAISSTSSPTASESNQAINQFISKIRTTPEGESVTLQVLRNSKSQQQSQTSEIIKVQPKQMIMNGPQTIGIGLAPNYIKTDYIKSDSLITAVVLASKYVASLTTETANGLLSFFSSLLFSSNNGGVNTQLSGPIGLIRTGSDIINNSGSSSSSINNILLFMAAISINLAVVNALPIPALDGGQLLFIAIELIAQRKVISQKLEENITSIAVLFFIYLTAQTLFSDISNIVLK